jgi:hypothetical protein
MRVWILASTLLLLAAGASATPGQPGPNSPPGLELAPGPPDQVPPFDLPVGPPDGLPPDGGPPDGLPPVGGPPDGLPPDPNVPAHGEFPLVGSPPVGPPALVPEPGTALLLVCGLAGLALTSRTRR